MQVLHLSSADEIGRRFNGYDLHELLKPLGVNTSLGCFWSHTSDAPWVFNPFPGVTLHRLATAVKLAESASGYQAHFQFWTPQLFDHPEFKRADLVHLQVIHDYWFRLESIRDLAAIKPTVWSWHDLWPVTGHCISPVGCPRWDSGCGSCPDLRAPLRVGRDRTAAEFERKALLLRELELDVIVSSEWTRSRVEPLLRESPIRLHVLPFGVDTGTFRPHPAEEYRNALGIEPDAAIIMARSTPDPQKGFVPLVRALDRLSKDFKITLLTVQEQGLAAQHATNLNIVELPWLSSPIEMARAMAASDVFAMPSTGESFGMMALEAMACGTPVLHVAGTATAEVVGCPELALDQSRLQESTYDTLFALLENRVRLAELGADARARAQTEYAMDRYLRGLTALYTRVVAEHEGRRSN